MDLAEQERSVLDADERRKIEYMAGVVEDTAAALRGEVVLDEDDEKWSAGYLMQAAAFIRKWLETN